MTIRYWISQIIVVIAYIVLGSGFKKKSRTQILLFSSAYQILMIVHFSLLSGLSGIIAGAIALMRNSVFIYNEKKQRENPKWILILFCGIAALLTFIFYQSPQDLFPFILTLVGIYSYWNRNTKVTRIGNLVISCCYIAYAIYLKSWLTIVCEVYFAANDIYGYFKNEYHSKHES